MKCIVLKSFRNIIGIQVPDAHPMHVPKGAIIDIGKGDDIREMKKHDRESVELLGRLSMAGCIGDATDAALVARVESELAAEAKREADRAARAGRRL